MEIIPNPKVIPASMIEVFQSRLGIAVYVMVHVMLTCAWVK